MPQPELTAEQESRNGAIQSRDDTAEAPAERRGSLTVQPAYEAREAMLRRPFTKEAVKWRVLRGSQVIAYIDVRVVIERLNLIVPGRWHEETEVLPSGLLLCRLTVDGQTHEDVGEHSNKKGLYSDALKRAAVRFGVGVSVYAIPSLEMPLGSEYGKEREVENLEGEKVEVGPYVVRRQRGDGMDLTAEGHRGLRWFYQRWLDKTGIPRFGEPIDHGDVEDSAGESVTPEDETVQSDLPDVPVPLVDAKADELRARCRALYENVSKSKLPKARFDSELASASTSHDDLEAFVIRLEGMAR